MSTQGTIFIGQGETPQQLVLRRANRHGLVAGATGTGKTVTLQILAEGFSRAGVPVFMADVKGDLAGISQAGSPHPKLEERARVIGLEPYERRPFPVVFWDLWGEQGHPVRTTISEMGPLLLSRLMELNETQSGVLDIAFKLADDEGLLLLDLKDLRAMMAHVAEHASELSAEYGNVTKASVGAIQRRLLSLETQGAEQFFGEPALEIWDLMRTDASGLGQINILAADRLMQNPRLYSTFLLWLLSELFEELPEVGDPERPKLVFFFDEAHLLFEDAPKALVDKVEQVVRLIRSKGVGVYFVTQSPSDVPDDVLGQLGNRVQHALRAFTPRDRKAVTAAAQTFRPNPRFDAAEVIGQLGVGEALVSTLDEKGIPTVVDRTLIRPPASRLGPVSEAERQATVRASFCAGRYERAVDRESAYEVLRGRADRAEAETRAREQAEAREAAEREEARRAEREQASETRRGGTRARSTASRSTGNRQGFVEAMAKSMLRSVGSALGRQIVRGVLGSLLRR
ncbi:MAG: DUF853 family protein [Ectothiorhodospiraceae bacterium]|nr:DUF853 family protein [Chromatiales bacterium]MCP5156339.1 DUF853 family protein [Ectothiorhodospiraceae bacterium]